MFLGDGERDLGHGGSGEPPVEEPSGEGLSMDGEGEGDGVSDLGEGGGIEFEDLGVVGREAPGEMEVGLGSRLIGAAKDIDGPVCVLGNGGGEGDVCSEDDGLGVCGGEN